MTKKELNERRAWSFEQKLDHSVGAIESFINKTGKVPYISFSGGKDSTVLLDLCRRFVDKDMKAVFSNTGNEYPDIVKFVRTIDNVTMVRPKYNLKEIIDKYGFPLISKEQAYYIYQARNSKSEKLRRLRLEGITKHGTESKGYMISKKWRFLLDEKFEVHSQCCDCLKKYPMKKYEKQTGEVPIIGTMTSESYLRTNQYIRSGGCNAFEGHISSNPLSIWNEEDIWKYIDKFKVRYCDIYDIKDNQGNFIVNRTGCLACGFGAHLNPNRFKVLKELYPKAYDIYLNYENNGVTYKEALKKVGVVLPD